MGEYEGVGSCVCHHSKLVLNDNADGYKPICTILYGKYTEKLKDRILQIIDETGNDMPSSCSEHAHRKCPVHKYYMDKLKLLREIAKL